MSESAVPCLQIKVERRDYCKYKGYTSSWVPRSVQMLTCHNHWVVFTWYNHGFSLPLRALTAIRYPRISDQVICRTDCHMTGSNTGLGFEAAWHFVWLNAEKVIHAVRDLLLVKRLKVLSKNRQDGQMYVKFRSWTLHLMPLSRYLPNEHHPSFPGLMSYFKMLGLQLRMNWRQIMRGQ